jgi:hypothetical protein
MLGVAGAWLAVVQTLALLLSTSPLVWRLPGLALGVLGVVISLLRGKQRRAWCRLAARGGIEGMRVRPPASLAELGSLPPMYGSADDALAVLEHVTVGRTAYRGAGVREPLASLPLPHAEAPFTTP